MRSSDDFFPTRPDSHGAHLHANALASLWFGEFMLPDWDMFQSAHPHGGFHAAARAVSGGPVYVSDKPGAHDAALLQRLVLSDGSVLRADGPARPTRDTLFADPTREGVALKVFNRNGACGVVALFHAGPAGPRIEASTGPGDVEGLDARQVFVAWAHQRDALWRCGHDASPVFSLAAGDWEIVSFAPVQQGLAVLGLADQLNSSGAITRIVWQGPRCEIALRDGGRLLAWAERAPTAVACDGSNLPFVHDSASGRLCVNVPAGGPHLLTLLWSDET